MRPSGNENWSRGQLGTEHLPGRPSRPARPCGSPQTPRALRRLSSERSRPEAAIPHPWAMQLYAIWVTPGCPETTEPAQGEQDSGSSSRGQEWTFGSELQGARRDLSLSRFRPALTSSSHSRSGPAHSPSCSPASCSSPVLSMAPAGESDREGYPGRWRAGTPGHRGCLELLPRD